MFYGEIDVWLNPELRPALRGEAHVDWPRVLAGLRAAEPSRTGSWRLEVPVSPGQVVTARHYGPAERSGRAFAPLMVSLHPRTGALLATRVWGEYAMTFLYDLHYTLLLGPTGKWILAVTGLLLAATLVAGFVLWWPSLRKPRLAFAVSHPAGGARRTYHLHKAAGVYGGALLLVLALTGAVLAAPAWFDPLIASVAPFEAKPNPRSAPSQAPDVGIVRALEVAQAAFPAARVRWIQTPEGVAGTWSFRLEQSGEPGARFPKTLVFVDRYRGVVLATSDALAARGGDAFLNWMHPLHSGEAFGIAGRVVVAATGLLCPLLFVTGLLRWRHTRSGRARIRAPRGGERLEEARSEEGRRGESAVALRNRAER